MPRIPVSPGRDRDAGAAVHEREAAGDVREREVVGVGGRAEVLDRGAEGGGELGAVEGHGELRVGRDGEVDPRLRGRDRHLDGRLRLEVGVGLRLGDDLDRIGAALEARRGRRGDVAAAVDRDRPARRGVGREGVGVGEAGLDVGRERDRRVLVGGERRWAGRDLEHVARVAVERDRIGAVAVGRDGDRAGVAVQGRLVVGSSGLPPTERLPVPGPRLIVPLVAVIETDPAKFGRAARAAAGQRGADWS